MGEASRSGSRAAPRAALEWPRAWPLIAFLVFAGVSLALYRGALDGPFISDDHGYIVTHPYTRTLDVESVREIFDPFGPARLYAANYAPLHLLFTAVERQIFAEDPMGYHWVNVLVHALNATLLLAWLLQAGVGRVGALLGAALFAVHPANVEAVAWISQLKTNASLALSLGALLAFARHPLPATLLFASGLLVKASAAFALPTAAAMTWVAWPVPGQRRRWAWVAAWVGVLALFWVPQWSAFAHQGRVEVEAFADPAVHLRTIVAVGARYIAMATTGFGVSAFQEPAPAHSWLDPWWLVGLPLGLALAARLVVTLRRRSPEAVFWVAAAASFAPVSQAFPFLNPVADRYLYFVLPGLIGGGLLGWEALRPRLPLPVWKAAPVVFAAALLAFGAQAAERAELWQSELRLLLDAAARYPEGGTASYLRARSAAAAGDVDTAVAELRAASERGIDSFLTVDGDPGFAAIRSDPRFRELVRDLATRWLVRARERGHSTQPQLRMVALAHVKLEEWPEAELVYERALVSGGPLDDVIRDELAAVRRRRARASAGREGGDSEATR